MNLPLFKKTHIFQTQNLRVRLIIPVTKLSELNLVK